LFKEQGASVDPCTPPDPAPPPCAPAAYRARRSAATGLARAPALPCDQDSERARNAGFRTRNLSTPLQLPLAVESKRIRDGGPATSGPQGCRFPFNTLGWCAAAPLEVHAAWSGVAARRDSLPTGEGLGSGCTAQAAGGSAPPQPAGRVEPAWGGPSHFLGLKIQDSVGVWTGAGWSPAAARGAAVRSSTAPSARGCACLFIRFDRKISKRVKSRQKKQAEGRPATSGSPGVPPWRQRQQRARRAP
jgi:hypothetical protein